MKKFFKLLCLAACVFCFTACSAQKDAETSVQIDEESYKTVIQDNLEVLSDTPDEQIKMIIELYGSSYSEADLTLFNTWMNTRSEVGEYIQVLEWKFAVEDESVIVTAKVDYSVRDAEFKVCYLEDGSMKYSSFNVSYTLAEKMTKAAMNTVIGISVVFVVLILICLLIWSFKFINIAEQALKRKKEAKAGVVIETTQAVDNTIAQIVQKEEEELVDDLELVAVISAAVAAYTGTSADGFVVRSIKKSNRKKWQNA